MVEVLQEAGFEITHVRGSHRYLRCSDGARLVVVPIHVNHDLPTGTLRATLRQAELTADELANLL
jgi:predicted RNA binding protein YcfA (HicA-like mRNA interferase family)